MTFTDVVDIVKRLSTDEKEKIYLLLKKLLQEEQRKDIYQSFQETKIEEEKGTLIFSSDISKLKRMLES